MSSSSNQRPPLSLSPASLREDNARTDPIPVPKRIPPFARRFPPSQYRVGSTLVKFFEFFCGLALRSSAVASIGADVFPGIDRHVRDDFGYRSEYCANETDMLDPEAEKYFMEVIKDPLGPTHFHFGVPKGISDPRPAVRTRNGFDINSFDATGQQLTRVISRLCLAAVAAGKSFTVAAPRQAFVWTTPGFVSLASEYEVFATIVYTTPYASENELERSLHPLAK